MCGWDEKEIIRCYFYLLHLPLVIIISIVNLSRYLILFFSVVFQQRKVCSRTCLPPTSWNISWTISQVFPQWGLSRLFSFILIVLTSCHAITTNMLNKLSHSAELSPLPGIPSAIHLLWAASVLVCSPPRKIKLILFCNVKVKIIAKKVKGDSVL